MTPDDRPSRILGPDPRLNGHGVALTWRQRGILAAIALVIGGGLAFLLFGIPYGVPSSAPAQAPQAVITGTGRAVVSVEQDGTGGTSTQVALPHTVELAPGTTVVVVEAHAVGRTTGLACTITDAEGVPVRTLRTSGSGAAVRCDASLR